MEDTIQKRPAQSLKECRACLGPHEEETHAATQAVHEAESALGPGNGGTKKNAAIALTLAAAHGGETVPVDTVQSIAAAVELAVSIANLFGCFGPAKVAPVPVPGKEAATAAGGCQ